MLLLHVEMGSRLTAINILHNSSTLYSWWINFGWRGRTRKWRIQTLGWAKCDYRATLSGCLFMLGQASQFSSSHAQLVTTGEPLMVNTWTHMITHQDEGSLKAVILIISLTNVDNWLLYSFSFLKFPEGLLSDQVTILSWLTPWHICTSVPLCFFLSRFFYCFDIKLNVFLW